MKKIFLYIFGIILILQTELSFAGGNTGILTADGITKEKIRNGDLTLNDIPGIIGFAINFLSGIAGTICVFFIIFGSFKILTGSFVGDKTKGRDMIIMAITGLIITLSAWIIIKLILTNFA